MQRDPNHLSPAGGQIGPSGRLIPSHPDALIDTVEAAALLGISPRTFEAGRRTRTGVGAIPWISLGARCVRYRLRDVLAHIAAHEDRAPRDPGPAPQPVRVVGRR